MKKVAIVGAGNAGCITALHLYKHGGYEIEFYHSPSSHPIERVGQGTVVPEAKLISEVFGFNWHTNPIDATIKTGFMYEGWCRDKFFAPFASMSTVSFHYVPEKLSKLVLNAGFKVNEQVITDPEKEIDSDYIFDCRGTPNTLDGYDILPAAVNAVLLATDPKPDKSLTHTRGVATPNGWTFIIPNIDSVSYGYLYNSNITTDQDAITDFFDRFNIQEVETWTKFPSYIAKNPFVGERTFLNGNRLSFYEPLEATALRFYHEVVEDAINVIELGNTKEFYGKELHKKMKQIETFVLWHYNSGSIYDTPFWKFAKALPFEPDQVFRTCLNVKGLVYGQWDSEQLQLWNRRLGSNQ